VQARHHCADRDVEDLGRVLIREVADVDEDEHVAEVVRHRRERFDDVLGEPLDDPVRVGDRLARRLLEPVVEEVRDATAWPFASTW
jgi:hypothetical protein